MHRLGTERSYALNRSYALIRITKNGRFLCLLDYCFDLSRAVQKLKSVGTELLKEKRERRGLVGGGSWFIGDKNKREQLGQ